MTTLACRATDPDWTHKPNQSLPRFKPLPSTDSVFPSMSAFTHQREVNPFEASFAPAQADEHTWSAWPGAGAGRIPLRKDALVEQDKRTAKGGYVESPQPAYSIGDWINQTEEELSAKLSPPPLEGGGCDALIGDLLANYAIAPAAPIPDLLPRPFVPQEQTSRGSSFSNGSSHPHSSTQTSSSASLKPGEAGQSQGSWRRQNGSPRWPERA